MHDMHKWNSKERTEERAKSEERKKQLSNRFRSIKPMPAKLDGNTVQQAKSAANANQSSTVASPYSAARAGNAGISLYKRAEPLTPLTPEPWILELVDELLHLSTNPSVHLRLVWPGRIESIPMIAALASLERFSITDLMGLRTIIYPTKQTSFLSLNDLLLDRGRLLDLTRNLYQLDTLHAQNTEISAIRKCLGKAELLMSLATIQKQHPDAASPTVSELIPHFLYEPTNKQWGDYNERFFARSIKNLKSRGYKDDLREKVKENLGNPATSPDSIFGLHHSLTKEQWKTALSSKVFNVCKPDLILINATHDMQITNYRAVQRVADFIKVANSLHPNAGVLVLTDEPATYFSLKKQLAELTSNRSMCNALVCEDGYGLSNSVRDRAWSPENRTNREFPIHILDRPATGVSMRFLNIAHEFPPDSNEERTCRLAGYYVLQACHLPGGLVDLNAWIDATDLDDRVVTRLTWPVHEAALKNLMRQGAFGAHTEAVRVAIEKAVNLIGQWENATPMALRLAEAVRQTICRAKGKVIVVFQKKYYAEIATQFLRRYFVGTDTTFNDISDHVVFYTQKDVALLTSNKDADDKFIFVGLNDFLLRLLLTSEDVPSGSMILVSYKHAVEYAANLKALSTIKSLAPYSQRISDLLHELEQKLKQVENPLSLDTLLRKPINFVFDITLSQGTPVDEGYSQYIKVEDLGSVAVGKRIYRYDADCDPPFSMTDIEKLRMGDFIFWMTEDLREVIDAVLKRYGYASLSRAFRYADLLSQYHQEVKTRSQDLFPGAVTSRIEAIRKKMLELAPDLVDITPNRIRYWLDVANGTDDQRPHAARDSKAFSAFMKALQVPEALVGMFWHMAVRDTRNESRAAGRMMADFYSNIMFHPESAQVYQKISRDDIRMLQQEALNAVFKVIEVIPPAIRGNSNGA